MLHAAPLMRDVRPPGGYMSQDRSTGAAANRWGKVTARLIASQIGATMQSRTSNEALLNGQKVVIKCAAVATDSVGVTYKMLERLDSVIGAFQLDDGSFDLWSLRPEQFEAAMRETRRYGASTGKEAVVRRRVFLSDGKHLGRVRVNTAV
jgi:hypothetical protein